MIGLVVLVVAGDLDADLARLAGRDVQLPEAEHRLVDDHLAVARHRRPEQVAVRMMRHLHGLTAGRGNLVDVVGALADVGAAGHDLAVVRQRIGDEVDHVVGAPHRPHAVVAFVGQELRVGLRGEVDDPEIRGRAAAIVLTRPARGMPIERERSAVRRIAAVGAPVHRERHFRSAADRHFPQRGDVGKRAGVTRRADQHLRRISRPAHDIVSTGVERQPRRACRRSTGRRRRRCCRSGWTQRRSICRRARTCGDMS